MSERRGYTLAEISVVLAVFSIVMTAIYTVLQRQHRFYSEQAQVAQTRDAVRIAAAVLSGELRQVSPQGGDLYALATDSVALRSTIGYGIACEVSDGVIKLWIITGSFGDAASDSALVFSEHSFETSTDDEWAPVDITSARKTTAGECPNGAAPELELRVSGNLEGVTVGSAVRAFRPYVYKLYERRGHWWLGQRLRGGTLQPVVGPFAAPGSGGLRFEYLSASGLPTDAPNAVTQVRINLKVLSDGSVFRRKNAKPHADSLSIVVYLRNS